MAGLGLTAGLKGVQGCGGNEDERVTAFERQRHLRCAGMCKQGGVCVMPLGCCDDPAELCLAGPSQIQHMSSAAPQNCYQVQHSGQVNRERTNICYPTLVRASRATSQSLYNLTINSSDREPRCKQAPALTWHQVLCNSLPNQQITIHLHAAPWWRCGGAAQRLR